MKEKMKDLKFSIVVLLFAIIIARVIISVFANYSKGNEEFNRQLKTTRQNVSLQLDEVVAATIKGYSMSAELIINDENVLKAFAARDREKLKNYLLPIYNNELRPNFGVRQFQFHTPPATSFLRLHKPSKFGDDLSGFRKTVIEANKTKKPIVGFEVGRGGLGLRVVYPVEYQGKHLGTMEFGASVKSILDKITAKNNLAYSVGIYKDVFKSAGRFNNGTNDVVKNNLVFYTFSNPEAQSFLKETDIDKKSSRIESNDDTYGVVYLPITDYSGKNIGYFVFYKNETEFIHDVNTGIIKDVVSQLVVGLILIGILLFLLTKRVVNPLKEIEKFSLALINQKFDVKAPKAHYTILQNLITALDKLREIVEEQHQILDSVPTPVMKIDREFNIEFMNQAGARLVGSTKNALIGKKCYDQFNTEHCNTEKCAVARAIKSDKIVTEETIARPAGKELDIMYTGAPIRDKNGSIVSGLEYVADISEVKEAERYLSRSTAALRKAMEKFANGDLTVFVKSEKKDDDIAKLFESFNETVQKMKEIVMHITDAVDATASASTQISSSAEEMAAGAQEQSAQTGEVSASVEEMAATIISSAQSASEAAELAKESENNAKNGGEIINLAMNEIANIANVVSEAATFVEKLGESSNRIGEIVQVINDIADQTNLLALNAAIEAARAGEQGRGFAVVADEVRKLAERTTTATKEIAEMIKQIQNQTEDAVDAMHTGKEETEKGKELMLNAEKSLEDIIAGSDKVMGAIEQVATASEEQSATVEEITKNVEGINLVAQESAAGVEQIAKASEDLNRLTENLQRLIQEFKLNENGDGNIIEAKDTTEENQGYYLSN